MNSVFKKIHFHIHLILQENFTIIFSSLVTETCIEFYIFQLVKLLFRHQETKMKICQECRQRKTTLKDVD